MNNLFGNHFLLFILLGLIILEVTYGQDLKTTDLQQNAELKFNNEVWTAEEKEIIATVERFLSVAGNYNIEAMDEMIVEKAIVGIVRIKDGNRIATTMTIEEYFKGVKNRKIRPYYEPVSEYIIHIDDGHLAFVRADAILHAYGVPHSNNIDHFTLIKENGVWKFISLSYTATPILKDKKVFDLNIFGKSYAQAWCSQRPDFVASFYEENGSLTVNNGTPAVGRVEISKVAESFMTAFPDIIVSMDSLRTTSNGIEFHWTFTGTSTGRNGTGKKVRISGFELWQLDDDGLIKESKGTYDAEEYDWQLKHGVDN
jgi:hypothetical protein